MRTRSACILFFLTFGVAAAGEADFAIRDGDTVVFLGDSITAARTYGKVVENYTLLRFPDRKVRFINAGWGGDTAAGGLVRLERDVFSKGATLLTVAYGINDIGWGGRADDEHRQKYLDSIRGIVEACKARNVRVYICSAALTAGDARDDTGYLQKMCDEGMAIARSLGAGAIDVQREMRAIARRVADYNAKLEESKRETMHAPDGIHLNELGQLAMGFAILKGLGAPAEVSSVVIDATAAKVAEARGCRVTGLTVSDEVAFERLDQALPFNWGLLWPLNFRFIPFPDELNRYMLQIRGLKPGKYELHAGERLVAKLDAERLAEGVNISSATADGWGPGGPWDAQANMIRMLTDSRHELGLAVVHAPNYLRHHPVLGEFRTEADDVNARIEAIQRSVARPVPYRFVIRPVKPTTAAAGAR